MGKGSKKLENGVNLQNNYSWDDVKEHDKKNDKWLVIDGKVYNISNFMKKHPGGARVIGAYGGQDATDVWTAYHKDRAAVAKYLAPLLVGELNDQKEAEIERDFRELRKTVESTGLLKSRPVFFMWHLLSILVIDLIGYLILLNFGTSWLPYLTAVALFTTAQAQSGWLLHDFGHLSVFKSTKLNHLVQRFIIGQLKGGSSHWWNFRHSLHHTKPNIINKDPDIRLELFFLPGETLPKLYGQKRKGCMPYGYQHLYFFLLTPLLRSVYFVIDNIYFMIRRRDYWDILFASTFFLKLFFCLGPVVGGALNAYVLFTFVGCLESHWFVYCSQMSHIPNEIDFDRAKDWVRLQLDSTCNVAQSAFNDWFTGHLNFQIEHHLFPTMPRHNFHRVAPLVRSLCKKHGINYREKSLLVAFADIVRSLKHSAEIWSEAYYDSTTK